MREQSSYQDKEPPGHTCQHPISIPGHLITGRPSRGPEPEDPLGTPILWFAIFFFSFLRVFTPAEFLHSRGPGTEGAESQVQGTSPTQAGALGTKLPPTHSKTS